MLPLPSVQKKVQNLEFLHQARHEVRTTMHVVTGMSDVLCKSGVLARPEQEIVTVLKRNAERCLELIDNMFDSMDMQGNDNNKT